MARLKIAKVQVRNVVVAWIVEQDESLRRGDSDNTLYCRREEDKFSVKSTDHPALCGTMLHLRGTRRDRDDDTMICACKDEGSAIALVEKIRTAVRVINADLAIADPMQSAFAVEIIQ